ncbi:MAG: FIST C-terminal domain-containing protein [Clostridiales bacterium]|nr:FIST C-terminal domain-containing protein [Clostridiales bacterium]
MLTAYTDELDDERLAADQLLERLSADGGLLKNSVGIIHCDNEFLYSGFAARLCKRLPFDVIGGTAMYAGTRDYVGQHALTLTVLTGGGVRFAAGRTEPISGDVKPPVVSLLNGLSGGEKPALVIVSAPLLANVCGEEYVAAFDAYDPTVPVFGSVASSRTADWTSIYTFYNGEYFDSSLCAIAVFGDIKPKFFKISLDEDSLIKQPAVITDGEKNLIKAINGAAPVDFLSSVGLCDGSDSGNSDSGNLRYTPFTIHYPDGSAATRAMFRIDSDGYVVCGGAMPVGSKISISPIDADEIVRKTAAGLKTAFRGADGKNLYAVSCAVRNWVMGIEQDAEARELEKAMKDKIGAYSLMYSGGEFCPEGAGKTFRNTFNNVTLVLCLF